MITTVRKIDTYGGYEITSEQSKLVHETLNMDPLCMLVLVSSCSYHELYVPAMLMLF
jgi:hypothetical protein